MKKSPLAHIFLLIAFIFNTICPVMAREIPISLPKPGVMVRLSAPINPPMLKGIKVHPDNPFRFDFILDKGDDRSLTDESTRLIKYFLASLTVPEKDLWVNLSPYEKDRIVPESFGQTEMGRDLLAQDYLLKQITASLIYPEDELGKKFWKRIYEEATKKYGSANIPVNTFNKVWIVPEKAVVYENAKAGTAYVVESRLKVMLEVDYLAQEKNASPDPPVAGSAQNTQDTAILGSQIVREIVLPELTREINEGANFAQLRQVYNSLILATWYKKKIKSSILSQVYADQNKVAGVGHIDGLIPETIYQQYLQAFKKGVYNYIKEEPDPATGQPIPRKYFSGGFSAAMITVLTDAPAAAVKELSNAAMVTADLAMTGIEERHQYVRLEGVEEQRVLTDIYEQAFEGHKKYVQRFIEAIREEDSFPLIPLSLERFIKKYPERNDERVRHKGIIKDEEGVLWIIKKREIEEGREKNLRKRERLAYLLSQGRANLTPIRFLTRDEFKDLKLTEGSAEDCYLTKVVTQGNKFHDLPAQDLGKAYAGILVQNLLLRKYDQHLFNTSFVQGIPISLDHDVIGSENMVHLTEESNDQFFISFVEHAIIRTVMKFIPIEADGGLLFWDTFSTFNKVKSASKEKQELFRTQFSQDLELGAGWIGAEMLTKKDISESIRAFKGIENIRELAKQAGYEGEELEKIVQFLTNTQKTLGRDMDRLWFLMNGPYGQFRDLDKAPVDEIAVRATAPIVNQVREYNPFNPPVSDFIKEPDLAMTTPQAMGFKETAAQQLIEKYTLDVPKAQLLAEFIRRSPGRQQKDEEGNTIYYLSTGQKIMEVSPSENKRFFDLNGRWIMSIDRFGNMTEQLTWDQRNSFERAWIMNGNEKPILLEPIGSGMVVRGLDYELILKIEDGVEILNNAGNIPSAYGAEFIREDHKGAGVLALNVIARLAKDQGHQLRFTGEQGIIYIERSLHELSLPLFNLQNSFVLFHLDMPFRPDPVERMFNDNKEKDPTRKSRVYVAWAPLRNTVMRVFYQGQYYFNQDYFVPEPNERLHLMMLSQFSALAASAAGRQMVKPPKKGELYVKPAGENFELWAKKTDAKPVAVIDKTGKLINANTAMATADFAMTPVLNIPEQKMDKIPDTLHDQLTVNSGGEVLLESSIRLEKIGSGSRSTIFDYRDGTVIRIHRFSLPLHMAEQFFRENLESFLILSRLGLGPKVISAGYWPSGRYYIQVEKVDGVTLAEYQHRSASLFFNAIKMILSRLIFHKIYIDDFKLFNLMKGNIGSQEGVWVVDGESAQPFDGERASLIDAYKKQIEEFKKNVHVGWSSGSIDFVLEYLKNEIYDDLQRMSSPAMISADFSKGIEGNRQQIEELSPFAKLVLIKDQVHEIGSRTGSGRKFIATLNEDSPGAFRDDEWVEGSLILKLETKNSKGEEYPAGVITGITEDKANDHIYLNWIMAFHYPKILKELRGLVSPEETLLGTMKRLAQLSKDGKRANPINIVSEILLDDLRSKNKEMRYKELTDKDVEDYFEAAPKDLPQENVGNLLMGFLAQRVPKGTRVETLISHKGSLKSNGKGTSMDETSIGQLIKDNGFRFVQVVNDKGLHRVILEKVSDELSNPAMITSELDASVPGAMSAGVEETIEFFRTHGLLTDQQINDYGAREPLLFETAMKGLEHVKEEFLSYAKGREDFGLRRLIKEFSPGGQVRIAKPDVLAFEHARNNFIRAFELTPEDLVPDFNSIDELLASRAWAITFADDHKEINIKSKHAHIPSRLFKSDVLPTISDVRVKQIRKDMQLDSQRKVISASIVGNWNEGEAPQIVEAHQRLPKKGRPLLIFGLRHTDASDFEKHLKGKDISYAFLGFADGRGRTVDDSGRPLPIDQVEVILLTGQGELVDMYAISDLVVLGKSRNAMEPINQRKPTLFMPGEGGVNAPVLEYLKSKEAVIEVGDLYTQMNDLLNNLSLVEEMGRKMEEAQESFQEEMMPMYKFLTAASFFANYYPKSPDGAMSADSEIPDSAQVSAEGGINFNSDKINLETRHQEGEIKFHMDAAMLAKLQKAPGFYPVIINIQSLTSVREFLGII